MSICCYLGGCQYCAPFHRTNAAQLVHGSHLEATRARAIHATSLRTASHCGSGRESLKGGNESSLETQAFV